MLKRIASAVAVATSLAAFSVAGLGATASADGIVSARPVGCC